MIAILPPPVGCLLGFRSDGTDRERKIKDDESACFAQALSPVGRCQTFSASADGYGRGEGFAVIALRVAAGAKRTNAGVAIVKVGLVALALFSLSGRRQACILLRRL